MKKYLLVLSGLQLGGAERQAINFAKYLKKTGRSVTILGLTAPGRVNDICNQEKLTCISMPVGREKSCFFLAISNYFRRIIGLQEHWIAGEALMIRLAQYIKKQSFDICISYCTYANMILGCAKKYYPIPIYVWYQRDAGIFDETEGYQKRAVEQVDYILANGKTGQEWIRKAYGKEAILIYNGIIYEKPIKNRTEWRQKIGVKESDIVCTMVANLSDTKDHQTLLTICKNLKNYDIKRNIIWVFAGRFDNQYEKLLKYVRQNGIERQIVFLGEVNDISGLMCATDICVFGAKSEGSPNGIIESGFAALPVVATDLPEIREILAEENYQYLFEASDIEKASKGLLELAQNAELRKKIGLMNQKKIEEKFSYDKNFSEIVSLVERKR